MNKKRIVSAAVVAAFALALPTAARSAGNDYGLLISKTAEQACVKYGEEYGICPELLMAVAETESGGDRMARNGSCKGLMQISERWNADRMRRLGVTDLYDEEQNIHCGADLLAELAERYGEVSYALDRYNGNSRATYNYEHGILSAYARKVLERSEKLERMHGK